MCVPSRTCFLYRHADLLIYYINFHEFKIHVNAQTQFEQEHNLIKVPNKID